VVCVSKKYFSCGESELRRPRTVYLDDDMYQRLKEICRIKFNKPVSQEIDELIEKRLAELEGRPLSLAETNDYERLKREHNRLFRQAENIEKLLKRRKVYDSIVELAVRLGLDTQSLSNVDDVAPKLLKEWDGLTHYAHEFISMLETVREMKKIESKLREIRCTVNGEAPTFGSG